MTFQRFIPLLAVSVSAGLVAAFLAMHLSPHKNPDLTPKSAVPALAPGPGPASYAPAVESAAPAVVNIFTTKITYEPESEVLEDRLLQYLFGDGLRPQPRRRLQNNLGSGVIIDPAGFILTNHHVVADADEIRVVLHNGTTLEAQVAGSDPDTDLAVLRAEGSDLPTITVGDSERLRVGDVVLAIGNPFGVGQTVTLGIVSATGRNQLGLNTFENFIQTDAAINPGNSGGALINAYGELVGVNTAIFSRTGGYEGIGFAIPVSLARGVMNQILNRGRVVRGWLGIAGQDVTPELARSFGLRDPRGVLVSGVLEGGPADRAGIRPGDIILHINHRAPRSAHDILDIISTLPPGDKVEIRGWRKGREFIAEAKVSERPSLQDR